MNVLVITETKLNDTFPTSQFLVNGFSVPCRLDWNGSGGGIMIHILDDIRNRLLVRHGLAVGIEGFIHWVEFQKS